MFTKITAVLQNKKGQGMVEYGLILALVAVVCIGAVTTMGGSISAMLTDLATKL